MEDVVLKDKHDLAINSLWLGFIDFDKGFYIIDDSDSEWFRKLNTSDGEPLTDAIDEREFWFEFYGEGMLEYYPIGKDMIYVVTENGPFIIDSDLEILDVLRKFN